MPIEVRHSPGAGSIGIAGLLSGVGRFQEEANASARQDARLQMQLDAQREGQLAALDAKSNAQMHAIAVQNANQIGAAQMAYEQTALKAGLAEKLQERQFRQQLELGKEQARNKAEQWEHQYTAKQRSDLARLNEAKSKIASNPNFSEDEKAAAMRAIEMQIAGIEPSMMPRDPNKPTYPEGREPGAVYTDEETGDRMRVNPDGRHDVIVPYDKSRDYLSAKLENEMNVQMMKRQDSEGQYRAGLAAKTSKVKIEHPDGTKEERDVPMYDAREVDRITRMAFPQRRDPRELPAIEGEAAGFPREPQSQPAPPPEPPEVQRARAALERPSDAPFRPLENQMPKRKARQIVSDFERTKSGVRENLPRITDDSAGESAFERLPPGTEFIAPDGRRYRK